jgi:serine phosphatase RsbU (regulator of sigma subunit)
LEYSESLIQEVAEKGMAALVLDTMIDDRFAEARSLVDAGVRSLVAAPLFDEQGALGLMVLGCNAVMRQFSEEDLELLVTLASAAALRIRNVALAEEAAERRRFEHELELARRIQVALLPEQLPEIDGYQLYGATRPSRVVSGDYFELIERRHGEQWFVLVADVSGKGIGASLLTGYLEALTVPLVEAGLEPGEVLGRACHTMSRRTPANRFATMLLVELTPLSGRIRYANAGHVPACLVRASGEVEWLGATGTPLGLLEECSYATVQTHLDPGDTLVMYSDGITEAESSDEDQFGPERLSELCVAHRTRPVGDLAEVIDCAVEEHSVDAAAIDDRTLVIVRRRSDDGRSTIRD